MADVTDFLDDARMHLFNDGMVFAAENTLDFSDTNVSCGDSVHALEIPAGTLVLQVKTRCETAEGDAATATVGDDTTTDGWDASINLNSAITTGIFSSSLEATDTYGTGKLYESDDTIDLIPDADLDTAKMDVVAIGVPLENYVD